MKKVLVVDDSTVDLKNLERIVSDAGAMVITASSGNEALAKARELRPNLIMLDVNMPGLDGFSTARQLAADPATKVVRRANGGQKASPAGPQAMAATLPAVVALCQRPGLEGTQAGRSYPMK